jgi:hypothetical protein
MKTAKIFTILALGLMVLSPFALAPPPNPGGPPGLNMDKLGGIEPRIQIPDSNTPVGAFIISESGSYYLTGDRLCSGNGIQVDANDVTIDLMGYTLKGTVSSVLGIHMSGRSNVEIRNGTVRDFSIGIHEGGINPGINHRIIAVRSIHNGSIGIYLKGSEHLVKDCTVSDNGTSYTGKYVFGIVTDEYCTVTDNKVHGNGISATGDYVYGIKTYMGSIVTGNTITNNGTSAGGEVYGIHSVGSTVTGNTAVYNGDSAGGDVYGIYAYGSILTKNTALHNGASASGDVYGIHANTNSIVTGNTANYTGTSAGGDVYGIYASHSTVTGNTVTHTGTSAGGDVCGIFAYSNTVSGNTVWYNGVSATGDYVYGIYARSGSTVTKNTSNLNGHAASGDVYGIWVSGSCLVDQNTATSNGMDAGSATNMTLGVTGCVYGINVAP